MSNEMLLKEIRELRTKYNSLIQGFNSNLKTLAAGHNVDNAKTYADFYAHCLFDWCTNINSIVAFQYQRGLKEKVLEWLEEMRLKDGSDLYDYISEPARRLLANHATEAVEAIWDIPYIEHIDLV